jgi:uncharacterized protein (TIGR03118 family)
MSAGRATTRLLLWAITLLIVTSLCPPLASAGSMDNNYTQTNLVSDIPGMAKFLDPDLVNPWGISMSSTSPFWVSDNGTGKSTLYNGQGQKQGLIVTIPNPNGPDPSRPTGQVFNAGNANGDFGGNRFIFATEDGTIAAWTSGNSAQTMVNNGGSESIYKGLAIGKSSNGPTLYAANFHNGTVDVFDTTFTQQLGTTFVDPNLPSGYAPFNIQNIGDKLYVTYALQDADKEDDVPCPGCGFVDVFDLDGGLMQRLISMGQLNSPWGLALAPDSFGAFGGDLLVGNFGDGTINAFDPLTGAFEGTLEDANGNPIVIEGLWALTFGNGANGGDKDKLYFTAGIAGDGEIEDHGLFGVIALTPEPGTISLLAVGLLGLVLRRKS